MRRISAAEAKKRGCELCLNVYKIGECTKFAGQIRKQEKEKKEAKELGYDVDDFGAGICCPFKKCKYRELDKYNDYKEYLKVTEKENGLIKKIRGLIVR